MDIIQGRHNALKGLLICRVGYCHYTPRVVRSFPSRKVNLDLLRGLKCDGEPPKIWAFLSWSSSSAWANFSSRFGFSQLRPPTDGTIFRFEQQRRFQFSSSGRARRRPAYSLLEQNSISSKDERPWKTASSESDPRFREERNYCSLENRPWGHDVRLTFIYIKKPVRPKKDQPTFWPWKCNLGAFVSSFFASSFQIFKAIIARKEDQVGPFGLCSFAPSSGNFFLENERPKLEFLDSPRQICFWLGKNRLRKNVKNFRPKCQLLRKLGEKVERKNLRKSPKSQSFHVFRRKQTRPTLSDFWIRDW